MTGAWYQISPQGSLVSSDQGPQDGLLAAWADDWLSPQVVSALHRSFRAWEQAGYSPGAITAQRTWAQRNGSLAFHFPQSEQPQPLSIVGVHAGLAAWLVLLDKRMDTFVLIARARAVWPLSELAAALPFITPGLLPGELLRRPPNNWERVARAVAAAVVDGPLAGEPQNGH